MITTQEKILDAFANHFFTVDNGAILAGYTLDTTERTLEVSETNEMGEEWHTTFTLDAISNAIIEGSKVFIEDTESNECVLEFYPSKPVEL